MGMLLVDGGWWVVEGVQQRRPVSVVTTNVFVVFI